MADVVPSPQSKFGWAYARSGGSNSSGINLPVALSRPLAKPVLVRLQDLRLSAYTQMQLE
jgi:hypothetical protein